MKPKHIGHCTGCGEYLWDPQTDPAFWRGERATVLLADGSQMAITLCDKCLANPDLDIIWSVIIDGWFAEGATAYVAKQHKENLILCVLYSTPWDEVDLIPFRMGN